MLTLYISYHNDPNKERNDEIQHALQKNIDNTYLDKIVLLSETDVTYHKHEKVEFIKVSERPSYSSIINLAESNASENEVFIIANDDIYFDESVQLLNTLDANTAVAMSRHEEHTKKLCDIPMGSQDVWAFRTPVKPLDGWFCLGMPGCDNRIAHELHKAGYNVINPALIIKAWHVHKTNLRRYDRAKDTVPPPYRNVTPCRYFI